MPLTSQDEASIALYRWQQLKKRYRDPGDRLDALNRQPLDYDDLLDAVENEMRAS